MSILSIRAAAFFAISTILSLVGCHGTPNRGGKEMRQPTSATFDATTVRFERLAVIEDLLSRNGDALKEYLHLILKKASIVTDEVFTRQAFSIHCHIQRALRDSLQHPDSSIRLWAVVFLCRSGDEGDREFILQHLDYSGIAPGRIESIDVSIANAMILPNTAQEWQFVRECVLGARGHSAFRAVCLALAFNGSNDAIEMLRSALITAETSGDAGAAEAITEALAVIEEFGEPRFCASLEESLSLLVRLKPILRTGFQASDIAFDCQGDRALIKLYGTSSADKRHNVRYFITFALMDGRWRPVYFVKYAAS